MSKIYEGDEVFIQLDCKTSVDADDKLFIIYKKPESKAVERWPATGNGNYAEYTTISDVDLDETGEWELQPDSGNIDVHGDILIMPVFAPLIPFKTSSVPVYMSVVAA